MKRIVMRVFLIAGLFLAFAAPGWAQSSDNDPATKDDIEVYLRTMHTHDMIQRTMEAMLKPMHQMFKDQIANGDGPIPTDAEHQFDKTMDELMKGMPFDQMMQAMIPVYQKHFTKGDITALNAFYSSPTGQKVLEELPAITGESMQAVMPIMNKYLDASKQRVQDQIKGIKKSGTSGTVKN
jgi:hypothetical protein